VKGKAHRAWRIGIGQRAHGAERMAHGVSAQNIQVIFIHRKQPEKNNKNKKKMRSIK